VFSGVADGANGVIKMNVKEQIRRFLLDEVFRGAAADELTDDADLLALGMDSMAMLRLTVFLEETFHVNIAPGETTPERIGSVSAICTWIEQLRG
jgi:acyl carrier protein